MFSVESDFDANLKDKDLQLSAYQHFDEKIQNSNQLLFKSLELFYQFLSKV